MKNLLHSRVFWIGGAMLLIALAVLSVVRIMNHKAPEYVTTTVERGDIYNIVAVSGVVEADNTADLSFPVNGIVSDVFVSEGDIVEKDEILITLTQSTLQAEQQDALGSLLIAEAARDELLNGVRNEQKAVTNASVAIAKEELERVKKEEAEKVSSAKRILYSSSLEALPVKNDNEDVAPTVSGTYTCEEGTYTLSMFPSNARSGYSYRLSGIENGTFTAYTESPSPLGSCGLSIQFIEGETYGRQDWEIRIPNTRSTSYQTNLNTYNLAVQQQKNKVAAAEQAYALALEEQTLENAAPRAEALQRADADVLKARARLAIVDANIKDRTLYAPFAGTITNLDVLKGETTTGEPIVTVLAQDTFEVTARIPEIDIIRVHVGQEAELIFDARTTEILNSHITFISPLAKEIDGVAYFEAKLLIDEPPQWIRSGLNADIDIVTNQARDVLRMPKRFLITKDEETFVRVPSGETFIGQAVEVGFVGNDGFVEVINIPEGTTIIAP